jgi:hypothetical protein
VCSCELRLALFALEFKQLQGSFPIYVSVNERTREREKLKFFFNILRVYRVEEKKNEEKKQQQIQPKNDKKSPMVLYIYALPYHSLYHGAHLFMLYRVEESNKK